MSLTDIMSAMQLHGFAETGLGIFFLAFLAIVIRIFRTRHDAVWENARHMPLDAAPATRREGARRHLKGTSEP